MSKKKTKNDKSKREGSRSKNEDVSLAVNIHQRSKRNVTIEVDDLTADSETGSPHSYSSEGRGKGNSCRMVASEVLGPSIGDAFVDTVQCAGALFNLIAKKEDTEGITEEDSEEEESDDCSEESETCDVTLQQMRMILSPRAGDLLLGVIKACGWNKESEGKPKGGGKKEEGEKTKDDESEEGKSKDGEDSKREAEDEQRINIEDEKENEKRLIELEIDQRHTRMLEEDELEKEKRQMNLKEEDKRGKKVADEEKMMDEKLIQCNMSEEDGFHVEEDSKPETFYKKCIKTEIVEEVKTTSSDDAEPDLKRGYDLDDMDDRHMNSHKSPGKSGKSGALEKEEIHPIIKKDIYPKQRENFRNNDDRYRSPSDDSSGESSHIYEDIRLSDQYNSSSDDSADSEDSADEEIETKIWEVLTDTSAVNVSLKNKPKKKSVCFDPDSDMLRISSKEFSRLLHKRPICFDLKHAEEYDKKSENNKPKLLRKTIRSTREEEIPKRAITAHKNKRSASGKRISVIETTEEKDDKGRTRVVTKTEKESWENEDETKHDTSSSPANKRAGIINATENPDTAKKNLNDSINKQPQNGLTTLEREPNDPNISENNGDKEEVSRENSPGRTSNITKNIIETDSCKNAASDEPVRKVERGCQYPERNGKTLEKGIETHDSDNGIIFSEKEGPSKSQDKRSTIYKREEIEKIDPSDGRVVERTVTEMKKYPKYSRKHKSSEKKSKPSREKISLEMHEESEDSDEKSLVIKMKSGAENRRKDAGFENSRVKRSKSLKKISIGCGRSCVDITDASDLKEIDTKPRRHKKDKIIRLDVGKDGRSVKSSNKQKSIMSVSPSLPAKSETTETCIGHRRRTTHKKVDDRRERNIPHLESDSSLRFHVRSRDGSIIGVSELSLRPSTRSQGESVERFDYMTEDEDVKIPGVEESGDYRSHTKSTSVCIKEDTHEDGVPRRTLSAQFRSKTEKIRKHRSSPRKNKICRDNNQVIWAVARINDFGKGERTLEIISTDKKKPNVPNSCGLKRGKYDNEVYVILPPETRPISG